LEENLISQSLDIYPNPTNGTLNVSFETQGSEAATLTIMDLTGKVIFQTETGNLNGRYDDQLNISKLARGTYMLRIENGDMTAVRRIIKQ
jgi:5-hydroxyisourate hydrolase-like protein (transthyretin family)